MTEEEKVRRFESDLDEILDTGRARPVGDQDVRYGELLDTADLLAQADFSAESHVRESLRRETVRRSMSGRRRWALFSRLSGLLPRRIYVLGPAVAALLMLVVMLAWPGAVSAAAENIERFVRQLVLDESTSVRQIEDLEASTGVELGDGSEIFEQGGAVIWVAKTTIGERSDFSDRLGQLSELQSYSDAAAAQEHLGFALREPTDLPDGYSLAKIRVTPTGWALSHYRGPRGPILIAHVPEEAAGVPESDQMVSTTVEVLTDSPIEAVMVNGRAAAWVEGQSLSWVEEGVAHTLSGGRLTVAEAVHIAESLR